MAKSFGVSVWLVCVVFGVVAAGFTWVGVCTACDGPQEAASAPSIDEMAAEIRRVGRLWRGCYIERTPEAVYSDYDFPVKPSELRIRFWLSHEGRYGLSYCPGVRVNWPPDEAWLLYYANGAFFAQVMYNTYNAKWGRAFEVFGDEGDIAFAKQMGLVGGLAFGWVPPYATPTEELLDQYLADAKIETVEFYGGESLPTLVLPTPYGPVWFGFRDGRVRFVRTEKRMGGIYPDFAGGTTTFDFRQDNSRYRNVAFLRETGGPIEYDDDGNIVAEIATADDWVLINKDGSRVSDGLDEPRRFLYTVRPLKPNELNLERIDVEAFGVPKRLPAMVDGSVVPYELRDGQLVKLVDGQAEALSRESGFRRASFWRRYRVWLIALAVIVIGGVGWVVYRQRTD